MGILEALDLCVLNSWSTRSRSATYVHTKGKSQIDFVITRRLDAHPISRRACPLPDAGLFEWRGGGRHLPLSVCVPARRFMPDRSAAAQVQPSFDLVHLREAVGAGLAEAVAFREEVSRSLIGARIDTPQALNEHVMPILARHFPKTQRQARARPWQHHTLQARYPRLWQLRRALGVGPPPGLRRLDGHVLRYWRLLAIYQREAREAKRASRALRKQHLHDELRQAENAYQRGDQKGLFEVMRRLAPKQRKAKVQLRGEDGRILSNAEELRVFTEYCRGLFSQGRCVATSSLLGQPFKLEADALEQHMRKLSIYKAVPAHTLPPAVWKLCRQALAPVLVQLADKAWQLRPRAPPLWCDSWLVWLNKVGKQGRSPDELRPIALQDTGGKIVSKHLATLLRPSVVQALREYPQFAYYPGRCLASALARVTAHCDRTRQLLREHRSDLYSRRMGKKALPCYGGLMMALDLSKAFDRVSRSDLAIAMRQAKVDEDLRVIILQWHDSVHYHLRVHTHQDSVHCTTGVRQGCCLAPYLWALLSYSILAQIAERTDRKWVQLLLNAYADDVHEAWEVTSLADLQWFECCVLATFAVLKSFRMIINEDKCVLVCAIRGHLGKQWLRRRTRPYKEGHALFLSDGAGGEICLPLAKRMTYLGTVLSYDGYEEQSLQHRLSIAELQRSRLRKPLQSRHDLSLGGRIRLWRTCIWSTLCHGLSVTGLGYRSLCTLTAKVLRHVRAITGNQVHVGGDDNQRVLQHVCLEFPGEMLLLQTTTLLARLVDVADPMISAPVLDRLRRVGEELGGHCRRYHEECRRAAEYFRVTQTEAVVRPQDGAPLEAVVSGRDGLKVAKLVCDRCFLCLPDLKALKAHTRQQHDYSIPHMPGPFQRDKHGKDGMPTCLHCDRRFPSWSHLERHIREHNCEVHWLKRQEAGLSPDQPDEPAPLATTAQVDADGPNLPLARRAQVKSVCLRDGWKSLLGDASLCAEMVNHCVLCHQWVDQTQLKIHTRRVHSAEWQRFQAEVTLECKQLARVAVSPCRWCGAVVKRASEHSYKCSVAWQACFLGRLLTDDSDGCGGRDDAHVGPCPSFSSHPENTDGGRDAIAERGSKAEAGAPRKEATGQRHRQGSGPPARKWSGQQPRTTGPPTAGPPGLIDQTGSQARGLPGKASAGHGLHLYFQESAQCPRLPSSGALSGVAGVARKISDKSLLAGSFAEGDDPAVPLDGALEAASAARGHRRRGSAEGDQGGGMDVGGREVGASDVESCGGQAGHGRGSGHHDTGGGHRAPSDHAPIACPAGDPAEVCGHAPACSGDEWTSNLIHLRAVAETPGGGSDVCHDGEVGGQCNVAPGWIADSIIERTDFRACGPDTRKALQSVLRLVFVNTGNTCYMNSFCVATLWAIILESGERDFHMGRLNLAFHALLKQHLNRISVTGLVPWRLALKDWSQPHIQHDVTEFAYHILAQAAAASFDGAWEARVVEPGCRSVDGGVLHVPISLELVDSGSLQQGVLAWQQQAFPHALCRPPRILCLRLNRFCNRDGHVRKVHTTTMLRPHLCVEMPTFDDAHTIRVHPIRYVLVAGIYHLGERPDAGHYRAFVSGYSERNKKKFHVFDDNVQAVIATDSDVQTLCRNCYLLYFVQRHS